MKLIIKCREIFAEWEVNVENCYKVPWKFIYYEMYSPSLFLYTKGVHIVFLILFSPQPPYKRNWPLILIQQVL